MIYLWKKFIDKYYIDNHLVEHYKKYISRTILAIGEGTIQSGTKTMMVCI